MSLFLRRVYSSAVVILLHDYYLGEVHPIFHSALSGRLLTCFAIEPIHLYILLAQGSPGLSSYVDQMWIEEDPWTLS